MENGVIIRRSFVLILSILIFLLIWFFFFPEIERYRFRLVKRSVCEWDMVDYQDLDGDGISEKITYNVAPPIPHLIVSTEKGILQQFNFKGTMCKIDINSYGDYDNNGLEEIHVFTYHSDSIFLHIVEPFREDTQYIARTFVDNYYLYKGQRSHNVYPCGTFDLNGDNFGEIIFTIFAGHAARPRRLYAYDCRNDTVMKSPRSGTGTVEPKAFDINLDGQPEFYGDISSFDNCRFEVPYKDDHSYLMVFNRKLDFLFPPAEIGGFPSILVVTPYIPDNNPYIAVLHQSRGVEDIPSEFLLFDMDGELSERKRFEYSHTEIEYVYLLSLPEKTRDRLFLIYPGGRVTELDSTFRVIDEKNIGDIRSGYPKKIDLDSDGSKNYVFKGIMPDELIATDEELEPLGVIKVPPNDNIPYIAMYFTREGSSLLYVHSNNLSNYYSVSVNPFFQWRIPLLVLIFLITLLVVQGLQQLQLYILEQQFARERKISELQLRAVKNQMDPHFALNILNSIGNLFMKKDAERANYVFGKYAKMLRNTITASDKISVALEEEVNFVRNYLDLEKYRMQDRFEYSIAIGPEVNKKQKIPKMLLHTFVENAVKHGLKHKTEKGSLAISMEQDRSNCRIIIEDNGIGRIKAAEVSRLSTGKGLQILNEILELYRQLEGKNIEYEITDLTDAPGVAAGTRVEITIPCHKTRQT